LGELPTILSLPIHEECAASHERWSKHSNFLTRGMEQTFSMLIVRNAGLLLDRDAKKQTFKMSAMGQRCPYRRSTVDARHFACGAVAGSPMEKEVRNPV
jgi:hypothetical protein